MLHKGANLAIWLIPSPYFVHYCTWKFKFALCISHRTHLDSLWVRVHLGGVRVRVRVHKTRVRVHSAWVRVHRGGVRVRVRVHKTRVRVRTRLGLGLTHWVRVRVRTRSNTAHKLLYRASNSPALRGSLPPGHYFSRSPGKHVKSPTSMKKNPAKHVKSPAPVGKKALGNNCLANFQCNPKNHYTNQFRLKKDVKSSIL